MRIRVPWWKTHLWNCYHPSVTESWCFRKKKHDWRVSLVPSFTRNCLQVCATQFKKKLSRESCYSFWPMIELLTRNSVFFIHTVALVRWSTFKWRHFVTILTSSNVWKWAGVCFSTATESKRSRFLASQLSSKHGLHALDSTALRSRASASDRWHTPASPSPSVGWHHSVQKREDDCW